ncbi:MAG: hypothetical protein JWM59_1351 [Verrucomicrobiales bacterium]|nr:hypothetical protein [Verrucomicrobiales bacterium]
MKPILLSLLASLSLPALSSCGEKPEVPAAGDSKPAAAAGTTSKGWTVSDWTEWKKQDTGDGEGVTIVKEIPETSPPVPDKRPPLSEEAVKAGVLVLGKGQMLTAVRYEGKHPLLLTDYEISWQGMRLEGRDFFASMTFPFGSEKTCGTFVTGGWGGWTTGITALGHQYANENDTTGSTEFVTGRWYEFTLQVTKDCLRGLIDGKEQFKVAVQGRTVSMHHSEIQKCMPLGFASYDTKGAIRNVRIRPLKAGELVPPTDE